MFHYKIFTDSSSDTPKAILDANNVTCIPFYVSFDQETYYKEIQEISIAEFYERLTGSNIFPKTSLPSVDDYITAFRPALVEKCDILCICLTSTFSGSYQSAVTAKLILLEEFPDANIEIIDSALATACSGLLLIQAINMKKAGYSITENAKRLNELKKTGRIMFTVGTLDYLQKGGRIGKAAALAGNLLSVKPILMLKDGELLPYGKVRGKKKSYEKCLEMVKEHFEEIGEPYCNYDFCVATGNSFVAAYRFQEQLEQLINQSIPHEPFTIGTTIGTNTGPDVIGACLIKRFDAKSIED